MEITILAIPSIVFGLFLGLITRNLGTIGLLTLIFLLCLISGSNSFSSTDPAFFILLGSVLTHATPIPVLQRLLDWLSMIRIRRFHRIKKPPCDTNPEKDEPTPDKFWGTPSYTEESKPKTKELSHDQELWDVLENTTKHSSDINKTVRSDKTRTDT